MTNNPDLSLWNEFNLAENNPDPGGGILYAIRYETEALQEHRSIVVGAIVDTGVTIFEAGGGLIGVDTTPLSESERYRAITMLEELSVVSEALEYHEAGLQPESIEQLSDILRTSLFRTFIEDKADAFDMAHLGIRQIVNDIETAHVQNNVLSAEEWQVTRDLREFAAKKAKQIANNEITVTGI